MLLLDQARVSRILRTLLHHRTLQSMTGLVSTIQKVHLHRHQMPVLQEIPSHQTILHLQELVTMRQTQTQMPVLVCCRLQINYYHLQVPEHYQIIPLLVLVLVYCQTD